MTTNSKELNALIDEAIKDAPAAVLEACEDIVFVVFNSTGCCISGKQLDGRSVIIFEKSILSHEIGYVRWVLFHEIAHYVLNHFFDDSPDAKYRHEAEACNLAGEWLEKYEQ